MTLRLKTDANAAKIGFLFPGQGAQAVGMGRGLFDRSPAAREVFRQVDDALERPLADLMFNGPEDELRQTVNAQPAIMAVSLACMKAMEEQLGNERMPQPLLMAGHSLGEYTALAVAGRARRGRDRTACEDARPADAGGVREQPGDHGGGGWVWTR